MDEYKGDVFKDSYYATRNFDWVNPARVQYAAAKEFTDAYDVMHRPDERDKKLDSTDLAILSDRLTCEMLKPMIEVRVLYLTLYTPDCTFLFKNVEDFMMACSLLRLDKVIWYDARFAFSLFDWYMLSNGWKDANTLKTGRNSHLPDATYDNYMSGTGARYKLSFWKGYTIKGRKEKVHKTEMVDMVNVLVGGLKKNCEAWDIPYKEVYDNEWEMYTVDATSVYNLAMAFDRDFVELSGLSYLAGDFLSAGGASKRTMLKYMYGGDNKSNLAAFHKDFPLKPESDEMFRQKHLYVGAIEMMNHKYARQDIRDVYKYDVNSMYPDIMSKMSLPTGVPEMIKVDGELPDPGDTIQILHIKRLDASERPGMIPCFQDERNLGHFYGGEVFRKDYYMFREEFDELDNWYTITYEVDFVLQYKKTVNQGLRDFVNDFYTLKSTSTGGKRMMAKMILNSAYGKFSEKPEKTVGHYEIRNDCIEYIETGKRVDRASMMNVVIGAYITALARTKLMKMIREVCRGDVENNFVYCDTDSIHTLCRCDNTSQTALGELKDENKNGRPYAHALYMQNKTYMMFTPDYDFDGDRMREDLIAHAAGVNMECFAERVMDIDDIEDVMSLFSDQKVTIKSPVGINVRGGKVRIMQKRTIGKLGNRYRIDNTAGNGGIFYEI